MCVWGGGGERGNFDAIVRRHEKMMTRGWKRNAEDIEGKNER